MLSGHDVGLVGENEDDVGLVGQRRGPPQVLGPHPLPGPESLLVRGRDRHHRGTELERHVLEPLHDRRGALTLVRPHGRHLLQVVDKDERRDPLGARHLLDDPGHVQDVGRR